MWRYFFLNYIFTKLYKTLFIFSFPAKRSFNLLVHQDHRLHFILQLIPLTVGCADWVDDDVIMRLCNASCTQLLVTVGPGLQWQTRQTDGLAHSWEESSTRFDHTSLIVQHPNNQLTNLFVDSALRTSSLLYYHPPSFVVIFN